MVSSERRKGTWASPMFIAILTVVIGSGFSFCGWVGDSYMKSLDKNFENMNNKLDRSFLALSKIRERESEDIKCVNQNLVKCCKGPNIC